MKIDYDELRKLAEAIMPDDEGNYDYGDIYELPDEIFAYLAATTPKVTLRLLKIIGIAKQRLRNISNIDGFDDHNGAFLEAVVAFDEIAKLENGE